jgi:hypothetical protein
MCQNTVRQPSSTCESAIGQRHKHWITSKYNNKLKGGVPKFLSYTAHAPIFRFRLKTKT